jgi:hypothetical protein
MRNVKHSRCWVACFFLAFWVLMAGLAFGPLASAQQEQTSLGDIARKLRQEKKTGPAAKTYTNENIPTSDSAISVVGQPAAEQTVEEKAEETPAEPAAGAKTVKPELALQHELDEAVAQRDDLEKEIGLAQRNYELAQQQAAQNPDFLEDDPGGKARLEALRQGIIDQQEELDKLKQHIADLQQKLDALHQGPEPDKPQQQPQI